MRSLQISVIILVHNNETTIRKCLESIFANKILPYEIIIVDNLSTDNSISIIQSFSYEHFKIIHSKKNHIGYARNIGLKYARGNYVMFIDADDYVDVHLFETLSLYQGYDVIRFAPVLVDKDLFLYDNKFIYPLECSFKNGYEALKKFSVPELRYGVFWIYCFKNHDLKIRNFKIYEDTVSIPDIISKAKKVINLHYYGYYHVIHSNSYSSKISCEEKERYFKKTCRYLIRRYYKHPVIRKYYLYHFERKKLGRFKKAIN
mgnify:FL=1